MYCSIFNSCGAFSIEVFYVVMSADRDVNDLIEFHVALQHMHD